MPAPECSMMTGHERRDPGTGRVCSAAEMCGQGPWERSVDASSRHVRRAGRLMVEDRDKCVYERLKILGCTIRSSGLQALALHCCLQISSEGNADANPLGLMVSSAHPILTCIKLSAHLCAVEKSLKKAGGFTVCHLVYHLHSLPKPITSPSQR